MSKGVCLKTGLHWNTGNFKRESKPCKNCGNLFYKIPSRIKNAKFCSIVCAKKGHGLLMSDRFKGEYNGKPIKGSRGAGMSHRGTYILIDCPICKSERWVRFYDYKSGLTAGFCKQCYGSEVSKSNKGKKRSSEVKRKLSLQKIGDKNPQWRGGKIVDSSNHVKIKKRGHPRAYNGYVFEHIVIMEAFIGRLLDIKEVVHHKNGIKDDNRIENLVLCKNQSEHMKIHNKERGYGLL